jgi:L-tryptophan--pyruvate aminotransferase
MTKFMELNTIGVSHDSQVRATQIIRAVVQGYTSTPSHASVEHPHHNKLFHFGSSVMQYRWNRLRSALNASSELSILDFEPSYCTFFDSEVDHTPGMDIWITFRSSCTVSVFFNFILLQHGCWFGYSVCVDAVQEGAGLSSVVEADPDYYSRWAPFRCW